MTMKTKITCRHCGITDSYDVKRHAHGAGYALDWTELIQPCKNLLAWWLSNRPFDRLTKDAILKQYGHTTMTALQARISELYALDLIRRNEKNCIVTYSLNFDKVVFVLNAGGRLKETAA